MMNINDFASELVAKNNFVKASFGGFAGSGKTRTACEFIAGSYIDLKLSKPILIIDNEKGSRFLIPFFKERGIKILVKDTVYLADVLQSIEYLQKGEIDYIFADSLTKVWYRFVDEYRERKHKNFLTLQDWGQIIPEWQKLFSNKYVELEGCFVFTGRGGFTYELEEIEENGNMKKQFVKSGVKVKLAGETPYEPDLNVWMDMRQEIDENGKLKQWREAQILKDRANIIDGQTFINPTYKNFKPVIDYLLGTEKGEVKGATDTTNLIPQEEYNQVYKQKKILLENIFGELEATYPGTQREMKVKKMAIKKYVFSNYSDTFIESLTIDNLEKGLNTIRDIINDPDGYDKMVAEAIKEKKNSKTVEK